MRHACLLPTARQFATGLLLIASAFLPRYAAAQITYGTLDNFDVINDTGGVCHGFEIELEGISPADVVYTFGAPYQRYGEPTVAPTASGTGVVIRYAASYDLTAATWSATTPFTAPPYLPTQGHSCWIGGVADPNDYLLSGCDHFGASLNATPTRTTYRWLVEGTIAGTLKPFGSNAALPAPVWNVTPPVSPGAQPVAAVAIVPPPPEAGREFGEALWAKVFVTELPDGVEAADLDRMVIDHPDSDLVPSEPLEVEIEWVLLQANASGEGEQEFGGAAAVGEGNEAVSRRFEFYRYAGYYDPETYEARCDNPLEPTQQTPDRCGSPDADGVAGVGVLIGAQNVAINLAGDFAAGGNHSPIAHGDSASTDEDLAITFDAASLVDNDVDLDGDALTIVSVQGASNGAVTLADTVVFTPTPDYHGPAGFTYTVSDPSGSTATAAVAVSVASVNDAPVADAGTAQAVRMKDTVTLDGRASTDVEGDALTYSWVLTAPPHSRAVLSSATSATPTFVADKKGTYLATLVVSDGAASSAASTVRIDARTGK